MRIFVLIALTVCIAFPATSRADVNPKRFALLIGNQHYNDKIGALENPITDIKLVGAALESVGFHVTYLEDAKQIQMNDAISDFRTALEIAGHDAVGFFYYSGHGAGISGGGGNYLLPIDIEKMTAGNLESRGVEISEKIVAKLQDVPSGAAIFIAIDACRNTLKREATKGTPPVFEPMHALGGMLLVFATQFGESSSDGYEKGGGSPFAVALARYLRSPVPHTQVFDEVQSEVSQRTEPVQRPVYEEAMDRTVVFLEDAQMMAEWAAVRDSFDLSQLRSFAETYRGTQYGRRAETRVDELRTAAIDAARVWLQVNRRPYKNKGAFAEPGEYPPIDASGQGAEAASKIVWQVSIGRHTIYVDPQTLRELSYEEDKEKTRAPARTIPISIREFSRGETRIRIDERSGILDRTLSSTVENVFLSVRSVLDYMYLRLHHPRDISSLGSMHLT